jgi:hypothetical protein
VFAKTRRTRSLYYPMLVRQFFSQLEALDAQITAQVAAGGCRHCGGPLHRSDYLRKPRGALIAEAGEASTRRYSLCCGRRDCRKRALPPSLRFLGRRVYLETVVVLASVFVQVLSRMREASTATGVPAWTLRRWRAWWRSDFPRLPTWQELRARFVPPPPQESRLPRSLLARLGWQPGAPGSAPAPDVALSRLARLLAPLTTSSVVDGSRFVRAACPVTGLG